jgi:membrane-associated protein
VELLQHAIDVVLHLDQHLGEWAASLGPWLYAVLFLIVFCETGLVVTPFLPGDSLLFAAGALAALDGSGVSLPVLAVVLIVAAVLGDATNYAIGAYLGPAVFRSERSRLLNPKHILRTEQFYAKYGKKTIFLARFVPIVRTFAPFLAGIGHMSYPVFATYNVTGAVAWVGACSLGGYFFGQIPVVKNNFSLVVLAIVFVSLLPLFFELIRARREQDAAA